MRLRPNQITIYLDDLWASESIPDIPSTSKLTAVRRRSKQSPTFGEKVPQKIPKKGDRGHGDSDGVLLAEGVEKIRGSG